MGTTNWGSQTVTVKFGAPVNSNIVNARHVHTRPVGVYRGGIVVNNNATATVSPFVAEVADRNGLDAQIRVRTANPVTIGWTGTQFLVLRWAYAEDTEANYVDIMSVDSPDPYDVILAQRSGTTSINYERRMAAGQRGDFLRVLPAFPSHLPRTVYIKSGVIQTPNGSVLVNDAQITNLTQGNRFIYVDISDNNVKSTATKSTADANIILARVRVPDLVTPIDESMIDDLRVFLSPLAVPDNETIQYIGGRLAVPNDGLDGSKFLLKHMQYLRSLNSGGNPINLLRLNASNQLETNGILRMGPTSQRITNVATPIADLDAANKEYVDDKIDAMLVVAHDYTLLRGSSDAYTTTLSTRSVSVTSGKQYLILVSGSTSTSNDRPQIALFVDGELKADIEVGANDNHNHIGKGFFLQDVYTATSTGSINVQIKSNAPVTLHSAQVLVIQIK
jgi:hypothetical protein